MRRDSRRREENNLKPVIYVSGGIILLAIIAFVIGIVAFGNKVENDAIEGQFSTAKLSDLVPNTMQNQIGTEQASSSIGKTVNELENTITNTIENTASNVNSEENVESIENREALEKPNEQTEETSVKEDVKEDSKIEQTAVQEEVTQENMQEETEDPVFTIPVEGEIIREFAKDKLVYSETLQEWIVHNGVDIKADKTTVVKASASGKVSAIKNDPRYGLTITIEHNNGFKTVYANLLTAEFVTEGEVIEGGQTIGTVGNTATFEILDEPHLHFEMIKDGEYVDSSIYIK